MSHDANKVKIDVTDSWLGKQLCGPCFLLRGLRKSLSFAFLTPPVDFVLQVTGKQIVGSPRVWHSPLRNCSKKGNGLAEISGTMYIPFRAPFAVQTGTTCSVEFHSTCHSLQPCRVADMSNVRLCELLGLEGPRTAKQTQFAAGKPDDWIVVIGLRCTRLTTTHTKWLRRAWSHRWHGTSFAER